MCSMLQKRNSGTEGKETDQIRGRVNERDDRKEDRMKQKAQPASCSLSFRNLKAAMRDEGLVLRQRDVHSDRQTGRGRQEGGGGYRGLMCATALY